MDVGWRSRAMLRSLAPAMPFAVLFALLPGPAYVHVAAPALLLVTVAFIAAAYADVLRDRRLRQHGLPIPYREPPPRGY